MKPLTIVGTAFNHCWYLQSGVHLVSRPPVTTRGQAAKGHEALLLPHTKKLLGHGAGGPFCYAEPPGIDGMAWHGIDGVDFFVTTLHPF